MTHKKRISSFIIALVISLSTLTVFAAPVSTDELTSNIAFTGGVNSESLVFSTNTGILKSLSVTHINNNVDPYEIKEIKITDLSIANGEYTAEQAGYIDYTDDGVSYNKSTKVVIDDAVDNRPDGLNAKDYKSCKYYLNDNLVFEILYKISANKKVFTLHPIFKKSDLVGSRAEFTLEQPRFNSNVTYTGGVNNEAIIFNSQNQLIKGSSIKNIDNNADSFKIIEMNISDFSKSNGTYDGETAGFIEYTSDGKTSIRSNKVTIADGINGRADNIDATGYKSLQYFYNDSMIFELLYKIDSTKKTLQFHPIFQLDALIGAEATFTLETVITPPTPDPEPEAPRDTTVSNNESGIDVLIPSTVTNVIYPRLEVEELVATSDIAKKFAEAAKGYKLNATYDINLYSYNIKVTEVKGGKIEVSIPFKGQADKKYVVLRYNEDGSVTEISATYANGTIKFETDHFSVYAIAEKAATSIPQTGDAIALTVIFAIMLLAGSVIVMSKKVKN